MKPLGLNELRARQLGLLTHDEAVAFIRSDSDVSKSEGLSPHGRIKLQCNGATVYASLYQVTSDLIDHNEIGLSEYAWTKLGLTGPQPVTVSSAPPLQSMTHVRAKMFGEALSTEPAAEIVRDIVAGRFSDIQLSSFVAACASPVLTAAETIAMTKAMVETGKRLVWPAGKIYDKHCIGGLPGNRTTPIVVAIVTCFGLTMPKTSSRAITSPAGTADTMETLTNVAMDMAAMRRVVETTGGCFVWGDSVGFSPADTSVIRIERALNLDVDGLLVASVLSKKIAAGATHVVIDMPVGPTAKMRNLASAAHLSDLFRQVAGAFDLEVRTIITDGRQPVGRGIGPALEAEDILSVLDTQPHELSDLAEKSCVLAGALLEMAGICAEGAGADLAGTALRDGRARRKFEEICTAQGGFKTPPVAQFSRPIRAVRSGRVISMNNRMIARVAKLAGAPDDASAGVRLAVRLGDRVKQGDTLFTLVSGTRGKIAYAMNYVAESPFIVEIS
ncbi:MAG: thymidine phosphorylase family protein [Hyphomonas sp.]|uniref:thymidine phosphorylase family protein n=1 Tax=Hyphomonas sp. TaxID=87 RepID=UPI0017A79BFD|nr:thymidine phosphorylase family protein [Hyphomonas sp.]MBA3067930.1 thymidine phosphorylase family protein [Hyphomonas sp.]MBU3920778.1 thymidine phosphorylase family protein [Alphaproteobacteria bacterium]MBU4061267.1 thymidine phosphorylase family protein [Alphaproteobacteria bacterium]MBU4162520.1 thymidine phosphorylase family protein [Alphaproteobacteria bacterium]